MDHVNVNMFQRMIRHKHYGMDMNDNQKAQSFEACAVTEQCRAPSYEQLIKKSPKITVHIDMCVAISVQIYGGKCYFFTETATPHQYYDTKLLSYRSEATKHCLNFIVWLETITDRQWNACI